MAAYVVVNIEIHDPVAYEEYKRLAPPRIGIYGGRYVARGGAVDVCEGSWAPRRLVILEFPTVGQARAWWESPEYRPARALRQGCARTDLVITQGLDS
ncbi:MAG: DUF1330 domain-containing protein [Gemmatimonadales bacterium]